MVNNSRGDEYFVDTLRSNGRLETAEGAKQVEGYIAHSRRIFDEMLTAVRKLGEARPDLRVVVRPHPSEDITTWESAVEGLGNVSVRREGAVTPWLLAADAVIHNNSTTGLEATLLGRPTIAFVPYADERYDQNLPNAVSRPAASVSELIDLIDAVNGPGGLDPTEANVEALSGHIAALDGPLASERMMDEIERIGPPPSPLSAGPGRRIRSQLQLGGLRLARKLGRLGPAVSDPVITKAEPVRAEKYPPTPVDEVVRFVERLQEATGRFAGVRCARLADQIYTILPPGR
jgi:hypothetical protein